MSSVPDATLRPGEEIPGGFRVVSVTPAEELRARAYLVEHPRSGARILHLHTDDAENLFSISFRTPPADDTGVPHIVEHSVLAGSRKFPVRDPFFEMVKMSMATFINAMTGEDSTYYPVCSNVKRDLFNLADVYFDAVFHPILSEETLKKEGHHLVPANEAEPAGALKVNGIVFNEMKSASSMPDALLYYRAKQHLLPDSLYRFNSGGEPEAIPGLTYADFKQFYKRAYHPSNAFFIFYGDIATRDYLDFLAGRLAHYRRQEAMPPIAAQPRWREPRERVETYPVAADEKMEEKTFLAMDWLVGDAADPLDTLLLHVLSLVLMGNEGAPLKKAVIGSRLGQDMISSGFGRHGWESTFRVGLKGSEPDRAPAFRDLVLATLDRLAAEPFAADAVRTAFRQAAYSYREVSTLFPLTALQRVLHPWLYDRDPLSFLNLGQDLETCRGRCEADPGLLNRMIRERLLANPHRLLLTLRPDRGMQARADAALVERMAKVRATLSDAQVRKIAEQAKELERKAGTPNPPEALATLPQLSRADLPAAPRHIPTFVEELGHGVVLLCNDVFTNGVNYLRLELDLQGLPPDLWPYVPRFAEGIAKFGAAGCNYEEMARRTAANTGGIGCAPSIRTRVESPARPAWGLVFSLKALDDQVEPALSVLQDLLFELDPRDKPRLQEVLNQTLAALRTRLVQGGPRTAINHASRGLSPEGWLNEQLYGLPQLPLVEGAVREFEARNDEVIAKVAAIRDFLGSGNRIVASFTGSAAVLDLVRRTLKAWGKTMKRRPSSPSTMHFRPFEGVPREGLAAPIQVAHCVQLVPAPHAAHPDAPLLRLATSLLDIDYMYNELRFKGNAYGAICSYADTAGMITLGSYADPHINRTLKVFADLPAYVRDVPWRKAEIDRAVISTAKEENRPIRPESATGEALDDHMLGRTREFIEVGYARMLGATGDAIRQATLEVFERNLARAPVCVVASREKLEAANREMPSAPLEIRSIL